MTMPFLIPLTSVLILFCSILTINLRGTVFPCIRNDFYHGNTACVDSYHRDLVVLSEQRRRLGGRKVVGGERDALVWSWLWTNE